jgi:hypothetical protein
VTRLLGILLLLFILRLALKSFSAQLRAAVGAPPRAQVPPPRAAATAVVTETLVACAACGAYLPASRALKRAGGGGGEVFCSEECRKKGLTAD